MTIVLTKPQLLIAGEPVWHELGTLTSKSLSVTLDNDIQIGLSFIFPVYSAGWTTSGILGLKNLLLLFGAGEWDEIEIGQEVNVIRQNEHGWIHGLMSVDQKRLYYPPYANKTFDL